MGVIPFPARRIKQIADSVLILASHASREHLSRPVWSNRPPPPEAFGNLIQRLALRSPGIALVLESVVVEILNQLDQL